MLERIDKSLEDAVGRVMDCKPNAFILGISALSVWGGNQQWCDDLKRRVRAVAGFDIPVALASDAVVEGLKRHGVKKKIAVMEPYYPSIEPAHARRARRRTATRSSASTTCAARARPPIRS